jgi:hypothetical protein
MAGEGEASGPDAPTMLAEATEAVRKLRKPSNRQVGSSERPSSRAACPMVPLIGWRA